MANAQPVKIELLMVDKLSPNMDKSQRKVKELQQNVAAANRDLENTEQISNRLTRSIGKLAAAFTIKEFVSEVAKVRGQFQQLEVAFTTMLQSEEKANALMMQLVRTAATTPFGLEDVAQGAKQLLAYGFEAERVNETLIRLGDIAAGLSVPLNDLVYLYGTTMAQGRLYTQDLNQFTNRGLPMISELAKQFGVAEDKVRELVEAGKVGFPEVQKVIESLTNEGGKFGGLMAEQSKTIVGQIANIEDSISIAFNKLGQQSEGVINTTLSGISYVVEHYERFGRILLAMVATYGTYRAAVMLTAAAKGWATAAEALHYNWLVLVERAQKALNATMLANPYVLVATMLAGVVATMVSAKTETERLQDADEAYEAQKQKVIEAEEAHKRRLEELCQIAGDEALSTDTRREALNKLEQKYPNIFAKYDTEYAKLKNIKKIKEEIALLDGQKSLANPKNEVKTINDRIKTLEKKKSTEYWEESDRNGSMTKRGGLTKGEEAELKTLYGKRNNLTGQIRKSQVNAYFEKLTGVSNDTLEKEIKRRENLLAAMKVNGKKYGKIIQGSKSLTGIYSNDELQYQLNKLVAERNRRNAKRDNSAAWGAQAKKNYEQALKNYNNFVRSKSNKLTKEEYEKQAKELKDDLDQKKKEYDKTKPAKNADAKKTDKKKLKEEAEAERRRQMAEKMKQELVDLQRSNDSAEIETMQEGLQKKLREIENGYQARKNAIDKQESNWKRDNKKAKSAVGKDGLTAEQAEALQKARSQAAVIRKKEIADANREARKEEISAMVDYLKEYGSFHQQKLALAEEYAQKIAEVDASSVSNAAKAWQKRQLLKEQQKKNSSLSFESISRGIDWHVLFSGVGNLAKEMMVPMLEQLRAYVNTDEYKNADADTQQKVTALLQEIRKYVGTDQSITWRTLDEAVKRFTDSVAVYDRAVKAEEDAINARNEGKRKLDAGEITNDEYKALENKAQELGDATVKAHESMEDFGAALNRTSDEVANFTSGLTTALNNAKGWQGVEGFNGLQQQVGAIDNLKGTLDAILPQMGEGMAKEIGSTLSSTMGTTLSSIGGGISSLLSSGLGSVIGIVAQIPRLILDLVSGIKGFVTGVLNSITELVSLRWIDDLVVSILDAVGNLINAIFDLPENLFHVLEHIVVNGVGGLLDSVLGRVGNILTLGLLSSSGPSDWFTNSNEKEVAEAIDRLTKRNELLEQAIEDLTDEMKTARGSTAIRISNDAERLQRETNDNYKDIARKQAGYHSAHHSWDYYWKGYSDEQIKRLSEQIGRKWDGNIWGLSPEEMKVLRSNVDMWEQIIKTGKGGYGERVAEKLNAYIEQAGKLQEITDTLYENLTTTTKKNVFDDFLDSLYALANGSEDVFDDIAENWQAMVNKMTINNLVGAKFQKNLEVWYEELAKLNKARTNGEITDAEYRKRLDELKKEYDNYVNSAKSDIEQLRNAGIINSVDKNGGTTQSGKAGAFTTMSQDQATKLEGLFVSGQMHWASIDDRVEDVAAKMSAAQEHLRKIELNTGSSAQSLKDIKEEMRKITRDGVKVK